MSDGITLLRADASVAIGTGHVVRCLTLADALSERGGRCIFICRDHTGHIADLIRTRGHQVHLLPGGRDAALNSRSAHAAWLGAGWAEDAAASVEVARSARPDWLIVDHYALDEAWERILRPQVGQIMVVDDLADRRHDCDLLLDQNLGRTPQDYDGLVPTGATVLAGPAYALLRPEFARKRAESLARRGEVTLRTVLISLGGIDKDNYSRRTLELIAASGMRRDAVITVVLGGASPWIDDVSFLARSLPWRTEVLVQSDRMAEVMTDADVAIGGAGATTWERACLGVPSALWIMADNQRGIAEAMESAGAAIVLDPTRDEASLAGRLDRLFQDESTLAQISRRASILVDGQGVVRVVQALTRCRQES